VRIVDVSPRVAAARVGGSQARIGNIVRGLAEHGHEVRMLSQPRLAAVRDAAGLNGGFERANPSLASALVSELGEWSWPTSPLFSGIGLRLTRRAPLRRLLEWGDVTLVEFPWQFRECARLAGERPVVLASHNVEIERHSSLADAAGAGPSRHAWLRFIESREREAVERSDLIVAVSEADLRGFVERYGADPERIVVAPNGADVRSIVPAGPDRRAAARAQLGVRADRPVVLFAGADVTPNRRALDWVRALARATDRFTFLVVGKVGERARSNGALLATGWIPDFTLALAAADISLCPVEFGGGTKIKLLESIAAGLPTVVFEEALHGTDLAPGEHVVVAPKSVDGLVAALDRLAREPEEAARIGAAARRHAEEHHDWRRSAEAVERALVGLVGR
jgi:glycosyltransferase involved in cell wall biosynthesis